MISERNADTVNAFGVKTSVHRNLSSASALHHATTIGGVPDSEKTRVAPLRVLKVTQSYFPFVERGGPAVKVRSLARGLAKRGHSVSVLTSDLGIEGISNPALAIARTNKGWRYDEDGVETRYLESWGAYRSLTWNPGTFEFCRKELASFDIVHIYGTYDLLGPIVAAACRRRGIPYVVEPMGMFRPMVRNLALKRAYRRLFGESVARGAARLVATSVQEEKELIEEGIPPRRFPFGEMVLNCRSFPARLEAFGANTEFRSRHFLCCFWAGSWKKKVRTSLIDAFARWRSEMDGGQDAALIFAGPFENPSYRRKLEARVGRLCLNSPVLFIGPLYDDRKWSALTDADIFVLPIAARKFWKCRGGSGRLRNSGDRDGPMRHSSLD